MPTTCEQSHVGFAHSSPGRTVSNKRREQRALTAALAVGLWVAQLCAPFANPQTPWLEASLREWQRSLSSGCPGTLVANLIAGHVVLVWALRLALGSCNCGCPSQNNLAFVGCGGPPIRCMSIDPSGPDLPSGASSSTQTTARTLP